MLGAVGAGMAAAAVHNIMVGASDHKFQPNSVMANIGDIICKFFFPSLSLSFLRVMQLLIWRENSVPILPNESLGRENGPSVAV